MSQFAVENHYEEQLCRRVAADDRGRGTSSRGPGSRWNVWDIGDTRRNMTCVLFCLVQDPESEAEAACAKKHNVDVAIADKALSDNAELTEDILVTSPC